MVLKSWKLLFGVCHEKVTKVLDMNGKLANRKWNSGIYDHRRYEKCQIRPKTGAFSVKKISFSMIALSEADKLE
jgi:hypothetical protein